MNIKKIAIIALSILLVVVAASAVVVFLNDSAITDAYDQNLVNSTNTTVISDDNNNDIIIDENINNNIENNINSNAINNDSTNANANSNVNNIANSNENNIPGQGEPEATTIEKERVVSETAKLSWNGISLSWINSDFNTTGIYHTDKAKYLVEHYKQTIDGTYPTKPNDIERKSGTVFTEATYSPKSYEGFVYEESLTTPSDKTIREDGSLVIKMYYSNDILKNLSYTVNYVEKDNATNVLHEPKTVSNQTFGTIITSANEIIEIDGYVYDSVNKETLVLKAGENVINIYYKKRSDLSYTVKYFYNGVEDTEEGVSYTVDNQVFEDKITSYQDKSDRNGGGWTLDTDNTTVLPLIIGTGSNVINVYYIKADIIVDKDAPARANAGTVIEYKIKLTNNGLLTDSVDAVDKLPLGVIVDLETLGDAIYNDKERTITWENISVANGSPVMLTFKAKIAENQIGSTLVNNVFLSNGVEDSATTNVEEVKSDVYEVIQGDNDRDNVNITLVIDISSTMSRTDVDDKGTTRLEAAQAAAREFVSTLYSNELNTDATISLVAFDADATIKFEAKGYKQKGDIIAGINSLKNGYGTNMYDGLIKAEYIIDNNLKVNYPDNDNVIVFLGDGAPYGGGPNNVSSGIISKASSMKDKGTTIYTVGFGEDATTESTDPQSGYYILKNMATEGKFSTALTAAELATVFTNIASEINQSVERTSNKGNMVIPTSKEIIVNDEYPIIVKYKGTELFRCNSEKVLNSYYMSYEDKKIVWDINAWNSVETNTKVIKDDIEIIYYIPRS